ncbi:ATP-binding protein, partial [Roseofilum casamattae]
MAICQAVGIENWQEIVDDSPKQSLENGVDFFAYDEVWVGRENTISELEEKVKSSCRVLVLLGITGIGKTALAERLAAELHEEGWLQGNWHNFLQENFDDEAQSSDFGSVAARWLEKWGESITPDDRKDNQRLL